MKPFLRRSFSFCSRVFLGLGGMLLCFQSFIIYHPRGYNSQFIVDRHAEALRYTTDQGEQVSWITGAENPGVIWLIFAGNGTRALDLANYFTGYEALENDVFVHVDYPGYGSCAGRPSPEAIRESVKAVVPALAKRLGTTPEMLRPRLRVFGHSLGSAVALMAMEEHGIQRGVLLAPFSSMLAMARRTVGWPLCELLHHRFDNEAALQRLAVRGGCRLEVIHGTADEVIPQSQSAAFAKAFPAIITYHAVAGARHNEILFSDRELIVTSLAAMR